MSTATRIEWTRGDEGSAGATWNPVSTHPGYSVNTQGDIRGPTGRVLRPMRMASGHLYVLTPRPRQPRKLFVHRAVLLAFVGPPPHPDDEARHLDGNPDNNTVGNLTWEAGSRTQPTSSGTARSQRASKPSPRS